jgi:hypothetical protein
MNYNPNDVSDIKPLSTASDFDPVFNVEDMQSLSNAPQNQSSMMDHIKSNISKKLLSDTSVFSQMQGEFSIVKGYGGEHSNLFSVTNPHKPKGQDHFVYTVTVSLKSWYKYFFRAKTRKAHLKFSEGIRNLICSAMCWQLGSLDCTCHQFLPSRQWIIRIRGALKKDVICSTSLLSS